MGLNVTKAQFYEDLEFLDWLLRQIGRQFCCCFPWIRRPVSRETAEYCISLVNGIFEGEIDDLKQTYGKLINQEFTKKVSIGTKERHLGYILEGMDELLRSLGDDFTGKEPEFLNYLEHVASIRWKEDKDGSYEEFRTKMYADAERFALIYRRIPGLTELMDHDKFWGSRQQLRGGKVIADWIDREYGPLDPVFGVLLCPTVGRVGPGDTGFIHKALYRKEKEMAYHAAVHDAFGYLITHYDCGPGYNYLDSADCYDSAFFMAGQIPGLEFWRRVLDQACKNPEKFPKKTF